MCFMQVRTVLLSLLSISPAVFVLLSVPSAVSSFCVQSLLPLISPVQRAKIRCSSIPLPGPLRARMCLLPLQHLSVLVQHCDDLCALLLLPSYVPSVVLASHRVALHSGLDCELRYHHDERQPVWSRYGRRRYVVGAMHDCAILGGLWACRCHVLGHLPDYVCILRINTMLSRTDSTTGGPPRPTRSIR